MAPLPREPAHEAQSADPGWPGASACGAVGKDLGSLGISERRGGLKL